MSAAYRTSGDLRNYVTPATICCPTAKPFQYTTSRPDAFYGFRTAAAAIGVVSTNIFNGSSGTAKVDAIEQPASFWVISDSLTVPNGSWSGAMPGQTYYLSQRFNNSPGSATTASAGGTAHFRHGGNINLLFKKADFFFIR